MSPAPEVKLLQQVRSTNIVPATFVRPPTPSPTIATFADKGQPSLSAADAPSGACKAKSSDNDAAQTCTATGVEGLTCDEAVIAVAKEHRRASNIFGATKPFDRNLRRDRLLAVATAWNHCFEHFGSCDRRRRDHIHRNAVLRKLQRPGARHAEHAGLCRGIG